MAHKWFHLVDLDGAAIGSTTVVSVGTEDVTAFRDAVIAECRNVLAHIDAFQLIVHESQAAFISAHPPLDADANIGSLGNARKDALVVVAPMRRTERTPTNVGIHPTPSNVLWFGSKKATCLKGRQTLPRTSLTDEVIRRLEVYHILLVAGPPMTGKTTLATLVCRDLQTRRLQQYERIAIASFSSSQMEEHESFYEAFQRQCEISWGGSSPS
jgi:Cdc6-like AAA superfamily ATPase